MASNEDETVGSTPGGADEAPETRRSAGEGGAGDALEGEVETGDAERLGPEALRERLKDAEERAESNWNELLRARAEVANTQRRAERDVENAHRYALEKFINEFLPVIDSLELGIGAAAKGAEAGAEQLREGMELTLKMCLTTLEKFGVEQIDPQGERFDPELHQAMTVQPAAPGTPPNHVLTVYQKGYTLNSRLVRPAMVVVSAPDPGGEKGPSIDEMA